MPSDFQSSDDPTIPPEEIDPHTRSTLSPEESAAETKNAPALEHIQIPGYQILEEIGRGGMGVVYKARHLVLNRTVALKMILSGEHAGETNIVRFLAEAEAVAALQHPNIVLVYDYGEHNKLPFMALEFVDSGNLGDRLREGPLPMELAATLIERLADGMHAAHQAGIVHRDLKPDNVLLSSDGVPKVTDFGLAKKVENASGLTQTGAIMGTPSYMAPEQASGEGKRVGPTADVYALGAVLYCCLTGRPPFQASTAVDTVLQVVSEQPVPPKLLNPQVDANLQTICLKCLDKDPQNRYASAEELAEDLRRYRSGEMISARSFNMVNWLGQTLGSTQLDENLRKWSLVVYWLAAIVFLGHALIFVCAWAGASASVLFALRLGEFAALGVLFWYNRSDQLLPRTSSERELWAIWLGYLLASVTVTVVCRLLIESRLIEPGLTKVVNWADLLVYPPLSILSGLAFFVMGNNYWGRCYLYGIGFFVGAVLNVLALQWAPLLFAFLWVIALTNLAGHMRALSRRSTSVE